MWKAAEFLKSILTAAEFTGGDISSMSRLTDTWHGLLNLRRLTPLPDRGLAEGLGKVLETWSPHQLILKGTEISLIAGFLDTGSWFFNLKKSYFLFLFFFLPPTKSYRKSAYWESASEAWTCSPGVEYEVRCVPLRWYRQLQRGQWSPQGIAHLPRRAGIPVLAKDALGPLGHEHV